MAALVAPPKYEDERKPVSPSSTSTRQGHSFGSNEPSVSSKTHEVSQSASTMSVESSAISPQQQKQQSVTVEPQKEEPRKIGRWYIGETLGKGGYSWYVLLFDFCIYCCGYGINWLVNKLVNEWFCVF